MHFSQLSGQEYTVPGMFIANLLDEPSAAMPVAPMAPLPPGPGASAAPLHNGTGLLDQGGRPVRWVVHRDERPQRVQQDRIAAAFLDARSERRRRAASARSATSSSFTHVAHPRVDALGHGGAHPASAPRRFRRRAPLGCADRDRCSRETPACRRTIRGCSGRCRAGRSTRRSTSPRRRSAPACRHAIFTRETRRPARTRAGRRRATAGSPCSAISATSVSIRPSADDRCGSFRPMALMKPYGYQRVAGTRPARGR